MTGGQQLGDSRGQVSHVIAGWLKAAIVDRHNALQFQALDCQGACTQCSRPRPVQGVGL